MSRFTPLSDDPQLVVEGDNRVPAYIPYNLTESPAYMTGLYLPEVAPRNVIGFNNVLNPTSAISAWPLILPCSLGIGAYSDGGNGSKGLGQDSISLYAADYSFRSIVAMWYPTALQNYGGDIAFTGYQGGETGLSINHNNVSGVSAKAQFIDWSSATCSWPTEINANKKMAIAICADPNIGKVWGYCNGVYAESTSLGSKRWMTYDNNVLRIHSSNGYSGISGMVVLAAAWLKDIKLSSLHKYSLNPWQLFAADPYPIYSPLSQAQMSSRRRSYFFMFG